MSKYSKLIVYLVMALLQFLNVQYDINIGLDEESVEAGVTLFIGAAGAYGVWRVRNSG